MTGKEALEIIIRKHCVSETDEEDEELEKCYKTVKRDLDILGIFRRGYGNSENHFYTIGDYGDYSEAYYLVANYADCYPSFMKLAKMKLTKEEYDEIKEWLENE